MPTDAVAWTVKAWDALERDELYALLTLRARVFVVEQNCPYLDLDDADRHALHLLGFALGSTRGALVAYARLFPAGVKFAEASIGRVVTAPEARRSGFGKALMREAIARTREAFGPGPIRIGAQRYLERFYGKLGFEIASAPYDEDGIPHVEMRLGDLAPQG